MVQCNTQQTILLFTETLLLGCILRKLATIVVPTQIYWFVTKTEPDVHIKQLGYAQHNRSQQSNVA